MQNKLQSIRRNQDAPKFIISFIGLGLVLPLKRHSEGGFWGDGVGQSWQNLGMKSYVCIMAVLIACLSVQGCSSDDSGGGIQARSLVTLQACQDDSECSLVQEGCCSCNMGGRRVPINSENSDEYRRQFNCDEISCLAMMSNDPSCKADASAVCLKGICTLDVGL